MNWHAAGWAGPEDFEVWFDTLAARHPRRGQEQFAKNWLTGLLLSRDSMEAGQLHQGVDIRTWLEGAHAAYRESRDWRRGYAPTLFNWFSQGTWKYLPEGAKVAAKAQYRCERCGDTGVVIEGETGADCREVVCECKGVAA